MKSLKSVCLMLIFIISAKTDAQNIFQIQNPIYSPESINSINFINETGWVFGNKGIVLKSTNGGTNFIQQVLPINSDIKGQSLVNAQICYVYDDSGRIFRTLNGGFNWVLSSIFPSRVNSLFFINSEKGFASFHNIIGLTTNSGLNWFFIEPDSTAIYEFKDLYFVDTETGYLGAINVSNNYAFLFKTTDSGLSWNKFNTGVDALEMNNLYFIGNNGWCAGDRFGKLYTMKTTNGGKNWSESYLPNNISTPNNIYFSDTVTGYITSSTKVLKSTNGGLDWFLIKEVNGVNTSSFINGSEFYLADYYCRVMKTYNGGLNFDTLLGRHSSSLNRVQYISSNAIWCNGTGNSNWKSSDGGTNWIFDNYSKSLKIKFTEFSDNNTGYSLADRGYILRTNNFGSNWNLLYEYSGEIFSLTFLNNYTGWAFSNDSILLTTNGGAHFIDIANTNSIIRAVFFDSQNGYGFTGTKLYKSTNSGVTWNPVINNLIRDFYFINKLTGWVTSEGDSVSAILRTSDGGMNWSQTSTVQGNIQNIRFFNQNTGYLLSYDKIYRSTNGGNSWKYVCFPTSLKIFGFDFIDHNSGWMCGENSLIMKLNDGSVIYINDDTENVESIKLSQNYPNPFNSETNISFILARDLYTTIKIYDLKGMEIAVLVDRELKTGRHNVRFKANGLSSGIYIYVLKSGVTTIAKKSVLIK